MSTTLPHSPGATCPSCGRFVGPLETCPHCGAHIRKRLPLNVLRVACLVLAILGVVILVYAASGTATPTTKIGNVGATMNFAYVRLEGLVTRGPIYDADGQTLRFYVADDTGEIQATTFRDVTKSLVEAHKVPPVGDKIRLEGTLRIRDDFTTLNVVSAEKVELVPPPLSDVSMDQIGRDDEYRLVHVRGDVRELRTPYQGLTLVTVGDAYGEIDVAVSGDIERLYGARPHLAVGDGVDVQGVVSFFRDEPQLVLRRTDDLRKSEIENTSANTTQIRDLTNARVNQRVRVAGKLERVAAFSQGVRAAVNDGTGEITLVLWQNVLDEITNAQDIRDGTQVSLVGKLGEYRGELEILPQRGSDVQVTSVPDAGTPTLDGNVTSTRVTTSAPRPPATKTPTEIPQVRAISSISAADQDTRVVVTATITRAATFTQGARYVLDDETGQITLLIWSDVLDRIADRDGLKAGAKVRVTGKIDVFNDTLEIIPETAKDVQILAAAPIRTVTVRTANSISTDDLDQTVVLKGAVAEITDFSAGKYVTLQDQSATIRVVVFKNVLTPIQKKLVVGANITVTGKVNLFAGKFEIVADEIDF